MKWRSLEEKADHETRSLREILAERKAKIAQYVPAETLAVHARVIADLKAQGLAAKSLAVGARIPEFFLSDQNGRTVSSAELLRRGRLVVCFFRGRWDPFCCGQMEAMNRALPGIEEAGASLVAISPQTVKQSFFMADQHRLSFPLLSDAGNDVARQFGLVYRVPPEQESIYRRAFINLPLRMEMRVGSCRFRLLMCWIAMGPCRSLTRTRTIASGQNRRRWRSGSGKSARSLSFPTLEPLIEPFSRP